MIQDKFTQDEWNNLVEKVNKITHHIPEHEMGLIWDAYKRIAQVNTTRPCGCPSAAKYWIEAMNVIRNYILEHL